MRTKDSSQDSKPKESGKDKPSLLSWLKFINLLNKTDDAVIKKHPDWNWKRWYEDE